MELEPKGATVKGPADWFTGEVFIDFLAQTHGPSPASVAHVHFTPGARTAWHSHSVGQSLFVTEGEGRIQARGEPVVVLGRATRCSPPVASGTGTGPGPIT